MSELKLIRFSAFKFSCKHYSGACENRMNKKHLSYEHLGDCNEDNCPIWPGLVDPIELLEKRFAYNTEYYLQQFVGVLQE